MPLDLGDIAFQLVEVFLGAHRRLGSMLGLFAQQCVAVFLRNLVIVGVDFAEGQKAVAVAAIFDERRLQRRFDTGDLGQIDIALELLMLCGLEIKLLDAVRSEEHTSELQSLMRISYAVFCLKKKIYPT